MGRVLSLVAIFIVSGSLHAFAQATPAPATTNEIRIDGIQGDVLVIPAGASHGTPAQVNELLHPYDRIQTAADSRVALRWSDQSIVPFGASTELEVLPPGAPAEQPGLHLIHGVLSFFHRDKPGRIRILTRGAVAGVEGTEFVLAADDAGHTTLSVVDGTVRLGNEHDTILLTNGQQGVVEPGKAPARTAGFIANNLLQWCFYYPAVLDPNDLALTDAETNALADSLAAYRSGDLLAALAKYPAGRTGISNNERIYHAALLLSVGEAEKSISTLDDLTAPDDHAQRLASALRQLVSVVKQQPIQANGKPQLASEFLAASYVEQARAIPETSLKKALALAKKSADLSPQSGFAWERVAELQFCFGQTGPALKALDRSLALAPRNAQALALKGFILAARDDSHGAIASFDQAIAMDSALGNAWLGRGLTRIRRGDKSGGREDLLHAAALEPQRAELRSYLGKAYANSGDFHRATNELAQAIRLDPADPTAWLYSALLNQQGNQINDAIRDLEKSEALNDNRSVYRSQLLLDDDNAIRRANLAGVYRDDGMLDLSLREAQRAVSTDYADYSSHLFLGNSYNQMRDPNWSNLRYESPANDEFFIANLLAPGSAGILSSVISEPAYARLFDQNRIGVVSDTEYLSRGAWYQEGAQFGTYDNFSYDFEAKYTSDPGQRPNNDEEHRDLQLTLKDQFTTQDSFFVTVEQDKVNNGDESEYYHRSSASTDFRFSETQEPNLYFGYHHDWSPGVHTLFFAARQISDESVNAPDTSQDIAFNVNGQFDAVRIADNAVVAHVSPELYSTELQQIFESASHTTVLGARYQWGQIHYQNVESVNNFSDFNDQELQLFGFFFPPAQILDQNFTENVHELSLYGYHTWQLADSFSVTAGLSYDWLDQPVDAATTPFVNEDKATVQFSPKVGLVYTPFSHTIVRAAYTRSLSGFAGAQSDRIEPTEVAGFNQAFRSIIPESVIGDTSGSRLDAIDASVEQKFDTGTYLALSGEILYSRLNAVAGAFTYDGDQGSTTPPVPAGLNQSLDYRVRSLLFSADQLLGKQWSVGASYELSDARLNQSYPNIPANLLPNEVDPPFQARQRLDSLLQTVNLHANWNLPSGLFSRLEANWYRQGDSGFSNTEPGDDFWQANVYAGYRFWHRRAEFTVGLLNIADQSYHLEPLNLNNEMAHGRTFLARLLITF